MDVVMHAKGVSHRRYSPLTHWVCSGPRRPARVKGEYPLWLTPRINLGLTASLEINASRPGPREDKRRLTMGTASSTGQTWLRLDQAAFISGGTESNSVYLQPARPSSVYLRQGWAEQRLSPTSTTQLRVSPAGAAVMWHMGVRTRSVTQAGALCLPRVPQAVAWPSWMNDPAGPIAKQGGQPPC